MFEATKLMPGYQERLAERAALGRVGSADEVAAAAISLLELDWVTGAVLPADGGILLRSPLDPMGS
jgi:NAD(P)-dependent dehydrogenase (short-subunit alcohol dehydrogenase family)